MIHNFVKPQNNIEDKHKQGKFGYKLVTPSIVII